MNRLAFEDHRFLQAFQRCELSAGEFHHREHLRVAYIYLTLHQPEVALDVMRRGLQRFLAHVGAPTSKYHETMTAAWLLAVHHFMQVIGTTSRFDEFAESADVLFDQQIMQTHYTAALMMSDFARGRFVEPDLQPIPRHEAATYQPGNAVRRTGANDSLV